MHPIGRPGQAAAPGFDRPFEMLDACHDRVRRTLDLLARLVEHGRRHGCDADARAAAADVLRYFGLAAPQHHEDEERHVVPLLLSSGDAQAADAARALLAEHRLIHANWAALEPRLQAVAGGDAGVDWARLDELARRHAGLHAGHLHLEDDVAFPMAARLLAQRGVDAVAAMGQEMAQRRGAPWPPLVLG